MRVSTSFEQRRIIIFSTINYLKFQGVFVDQAQPFFLSLVPGVWVR